MEGTAPTVESLRSEVERAAIYWRVSSLEQGEGYSPDSQIRACREYADRQAYRVVRILGDMITGKRMDRPAFQYLMHLASRRSFDVLLVWKGDRLARNELGAGQVRKRLRDLGIRIESVQFGRQDDTPATRFSTRMVDLFAEFDRENIAERTTQGRFDHARAGLWPAKAPYGYRKEIEKEASRLVIHEEEAKRMREAFQAVIMGKNRRYVADMMATEPTTANGRIRNPLYKGEAHYGDVLVPCPPIVDPETWQRAQDAMRSRWREKAPHAAPYSKREIGRDQGRKPSVPRHRVPSGSAAEAAALVGAAAPQVLGGVAARPADPGHGPAAVPDS